MAGFDILIRDAGGAWVRPTELLYENEKHMQQLLAENPSWVPGVKTEAIVAKEILTTAGPADICVITSDGSITVVECKLHTNSESRRMVIGQVLDYASAISLAGPEALRESWKQATNEDPQEWLGADAWEQVVENLERGFINLCLAVDAIDDDIRRLVEYLNKISIPAVAATALELQYAKREDLEILVPRVFGEEIAAAKSTKTLWTSEQVLEHLRTYESSEIAEFVELLLKACVENGCKILGGTATAPSLTIWFDSPGGRVIPYAIYCAPEEGSGLLEFGFLWTTNAAESDRMEFARKVTALPDLGISLEELEALNFRKRPTVSLKKISTIPEIVGLLASAQKALQGS